MLYICLFFSKKREKNQLSLQEPKDYKAKCGYRNQAPNNYHSIRYKWKHCATSSMIRMNMAKKKKRTRKSDHRTLNPSIAQNLEPRVAFASVRTA